MSKTGSHLRIRELADKVLGVELFGDRSRPEPDHFRVKFPGGIVDIARTTDGDHWVHTVVNNPRRVGFDPAGQDVGAIVDARSGDADPVSFDDQGEIVDTRAHHVFGTSDMMVGLYDLAVRVRKVAEPEDREQYEISRRHAAERCSEDDCHVLASGRRLDGSLTCGNHEKDGQERVLAENCQLTVRGRHIIVRSGGKVCFVMDIGRHVEFGSYSSPGIEASMVFGYMKKGAL